MVCREPMEDLLKKFSALVRLSGKEDGETACSYIVDQLKKYGVPYKVYEIPLYVSNPQSAKIVFQMKDSAGEGIEIKKVALPRSFSGDCRQGITKELFYDVKAHEFLGPFKRDEWYEQCRDKIVVSDNFYEDYVQMIISYGAAGLIHAWTSEEEILHNETVCPVWGTAEPSNQNTLPKIPVAGITKKDGEEIFSLLKPGVNDAKATLVSKVEYEVTKASFPVAEIKGETDKFILLGNHFDSWHEGVTDNGTGNAAALEIARLLQEAKTGRRGVKIAWWPAHSNGRYAGSTWYCDNEFMELYENCVGLINVDSPGCRGAKEVGFSTSGIVSDSLKKMVFDHTEQSEVVVKPLGRGSDLSFYGVQIPIQISFDYYQEGENRGRWHCAGCGGGWWWHTAEDNYDKIDYEYLIRDTEIIWDMIEYLRNTKELPFDSMQCMEGIENLIEEIDKNSDEAFDFTPIKSKAALLKQKAAHMKIFKNDVLAKKIGGRLSMLLCSACDEYHYDNTFSVGQLPGLQMVKGYYRDQMDERDFLFLQTAFIRQRNRTVAELKKIIEIWEEENERIF